MTCPECGRGSLLQAGGYAHEPHGETHWDEWSECSHCHETFSEADIPYCLGCNDTGMDDASDGVCVCSTPRAPDAQGGAK